LKSMVACGENIISSLGNFAPEVVILDIEYATLGLEMAP